VIYRAILGRIIFRTAVHVGSGRATDAIDAFLRRDATGAVVIPGTAIAGALRGIATRLAPQLGMRACNALQPESEWAKFENGVLKGQKQPCKCPVCQLFGDILPGNGDRQPEKDVYEADTASSRVLTADAYLVADRLSDAGTSIRDGVGINRSDGAAARAGAVKFDMETLALRAEFKLRIELSPQVDEVGEDILAAALMEWAEGRGALGGRTSRGLGAFDLRDIRRVSIGDDARGLMAFLRTANPWESASVDTEWFVIASARVRARLKQQSRTATHVKQEGLVTRAFAHVTFTLVGDGPLLVNDTTMAALTGFDHAPILARWLTGAPTTGTGPLDLVLPGSSLRGVLRAQAEKIARTLTTQRIAQLPKNQTAEFVLHCPACNPVESRDTAALSSCDTLLLGSLNELDEVEPERVCLACRLFGSTQSGSRLKIEDACWSVSLPAKCLKVQDFLAIDRFTGGGLDGAKFDALAVMNARFTVNMRLDNPTPWEMGWLALALRDLRDGMIQVGMGASKGYGNVHAEDMKICLGTVHQDDRERFGAQLDWSNVASSGAFDTITCSEADWDHHPEWAIAISGWVEAFQAKLKTVARSLGNHKADVLVDSYFGTSAQSHYPVAFKNVEKR